jgi:uncharacterized protein
MKINLSKYALQESFGPINIKVNSRLPFFVSSPCELTYNYTIKPHQDFYILDLALEGTILITCQRCLSEFDYFFKHQSEIAVCRKDEMAEKLMATYECIVSNSYEIDLDEVITDELHLFCPEKHAEFSDCDVSAE